MRLLKQQYRHYPLSVIERVFRDEQAVDAPIDSFLRICAIVREELQAREGADRYTPLPLKQLELWCDATRDMEPWLALKDDPKAGRMVSLRPAARQALEITLGTEEEGDALSAQALGRFFDGISTAATHLRQDKAALLEKLRAEVADREREIARIEQQGVAPATRQDKERYAAELTKFVTETLNLVGKVPSRLRENIRAARASFYETEGSHGQLVKSVLEILNQERERPGYMTLFEMSRIHDDARRREFMEDAVETILEECEEFLTDRSCREARTLFSAMTDLGLRILAEDAQAAAQVRNFLEHESFARRRGQARLLSDLADKMRDAAPNMKLRARGGGGIPEPGFRITQERVSKLHWFELRLGLEPPAEPNAVEAPPAAGPLDEERALRAIQRGADKGRELNEKRLTTWIRGIVAENGPTPLSRVLKHRPLRYGIEELGRLLQIAMHSVPAEFRPGWEMEMGLQDERLQAFGGPGAMHLVRCPDPLFVAEGEPGRGLVPDGGLAPCSESIEETLAFIGAEITLGTGAMPVRVIRPEWALPPRSNVAA